MSGLDPFRRRLDELDEQITRLLGARFDVCREIALYKREHDIPMMQPGRVAQVRERYLTRGAELGLPPDFTATLFDLLISATCRMEDELIEMLADEALERSFPDDELIEAPPSEPGGRAS
jgi:chorismate mutase-like protein